MLRNILTLIKKLKIQKSIVVSDLYVWVCQADFHSWTHFLFCHMIMDLFSSDSGNQTLLRISSLWKPNKCNFVLGNYVFIIVSKTYFIIGFGKKKNLMFILFPFWATWYLLSLSKCVCVRAGVCLRVCPAVDRSSLPCHPLVGLGSAPVTLISNK